MNKEKNVGVSPLLGIPNAKLGFIIKDGSVTIKKLAAEVLNLIYSGGGSGGGIVQLIDLSDRMTGDNTTVTDMEVKTSLFLYNVYDRVSGIARVVESETEDRYLLFKVCCYDGNENKILYVAYTTEDDFSANATWHYYKTIDAEDTLYPWAMSVFGDVAVDNENNLLIVGNYKYRLEPYSDEPIISYFYNVPEIVEFKYDPIDANGGTVYPYIEFKQTITKIIDYGTRTEEQQLTLTGTIEYLNAKYGVTYSDRSLVVNEVSTVFTGNNPYQSGGVDNIGAVTVTASDVASVRDVRTVTLSLSLNGDNKTATETTTVKQDAAWIDAAKNINIGSAGETNIVEVKKSVGIWVENLDVTSNSDWITVSSVLVEDSKIKIAYTVAANSSVSSRAGSITVLTDIAGLQGTVNIIQAAAGAIINVSSTSVNFSTTNVGSTASANITVSGINLSGPITISKNGSNKEMFSVTPASISAEEAASGKVVTISYAPTAADTHTGKLTLSSNGAEPVEISLSGTASKSGAAGIGYYGVSTAAAGLPTSLAGASGTFEISDGKSVTVSGSGRYAWIALPVNCGVKSVTGVDKEGEEIEVLVNTTNISGYVLYYKSGYSMNFTNDAFTFTLHKEEQSGDVSGSFYIGQCSAKPAAFGQLSASDLAGYSTLTAMSSGAAASGSINGVSVDGCRSFDTAITAGNETFFVMIPSNLDITLAAFHAAIESYSSNAEIKNSDYWEAVHSDVNIDGTAYRVYGYNNIALPGSIVTVYIKTI